MATAVPLAVPAVSTTGRCGLAEVWFPGVDVGRQGWSVPAEAALRALWREKWTVACIAAALRTKRGVVVDKAAQLRLEARGSVRHADSARALGEDLTARKRAKVAPVEAPPPPAVVAPPPLSYEAPGGPLAGLSATERALWPRVLAILRQAAEAGQRCPGNVELAGMLGFSSGSTASALLATLHRVGLLVVTSGHCARVVAAPDGSWRTAGDAEAKWPRAPRVLAPKPSAPRRSAVNIAPASAPAGPPAPVLNPELELARARQRSAREAAARRQALLHPAPMPALPTRPPVALQGGCRFPVWPHEASRAHPDFGRCCEGARLPGKPYCAEHAARAFAHHAAPAAECVA